MKTALSALLALLSLGGAALAADQAPSQLRNENLMTPLPKGFTVGSRGRDGPMIGAEYVPAGETVQDWSRMVTVQIFQNLKSFDPDAFAGRLQKGWSKGCPLSDVHKLKGGREHGYGFSLWAYLCPFNPRTGKPETAYMKFISGKDALYVVQYAYRAPLTSENIPRAMTYLGGVWVCDTRLADHACPKVTAPPR